MRNVLADRQYAQEQREMLRDMAEGELPAGITPEMIRDLMGPEDPIARVSNVRAFVAGIYALEERLRRTCRRLRAADDRIAAQDRDMESMGRKIKKHEELLSWFESNEKVNPREGVSIAPPPVEPDELPILHIM